MVNESQNFTIEQAKNYAEDLLVANFSFDDVRIKLNKKNIDEYQANEIIKSFYLEKLKRSLKYSIITMVVLLLIIIALVSLYYYGEAQNQKIALQRIEAGYGTKNADGTYMVIGQFQNYKYLQKITGWAGLIAIFYAIRSVLILIKTRKFNRLWELK